jgi:hypothetical protein
MKLITILVALAALAVVPAFADGNFLVKYVSNLQIGDSFINVTNTGAAQGQNLQLSTNGLPSQTQRSGNICVNIYVFTPDEQEAECCSCLLTANGLATFSARSLSANALTGVVPSDIVIKLVATASCIPQATGGCFGGVPGFSGSSPSDCNAATAGLQPTFDTFGNLDLTFGTTSGQPLAIPKGFTAPTEEGPLAAWGTALHANTSALPSYQVTETRFTQSILSSGELNRITGLCANIQTNGSGFGICPRDKGFCVSGPPPAIR